MGRDNCDAQIEGRAVYDGYKLGSLPFTYIGRTGGYDGWELRNDLAIGGWETWPYEVRVAKIAGNHNWFRISDFVAAIDLRADGNSHALAGRERYCEGCFTTRAAEQFSDDSEFCVDCR